MIIRAYTRPFKHISRTDARSMSARSLSEVIHGKAKRKAEPKPEWTCTACTQGRHTSCVSDRCSCGRKHL